MYIIYSDSDLSCVLLYEEKEYIVKNVLYLLVNFIVYLNIIKVKLRYLYLYKNNEVK